MKFQDGGRQKEIAEYTPRPGLKKGGQNVRERQREIAEYTPRVGLSMGGQNVTICISKNSRMGAAGGYR